MSNLTVKMPTANGEFVLKNPIMPAAATFGNIIEYNNYFDLSKLGALIPNSIAIDTGKPTNAKKLAITESGVISALNRNNMSIHEFNEQVVPKLPYESTPIIVDLKAADMDEMEELAKIVEGMEHIAAIEVNLNCPYGGPGAPYWKDPAQLEELIRRVRQAAPGKVLLAKCPKPECNVEMAVKACEKGGVDIFASFNSISGTSIDINTRKFSCGGGGSGGYSGAGMKPVGINLCYRACQASSLPIIGVGGITCAEDVLEFIMAGAHAVQVGGANLRRPDFIARMVDDLDALLDRMGIASLDEVRGCATV